MKRLGLFIILLSIGCIYSYGQSRKKIKEMGISSKTTYDVDYENTNGKEYIDEKEIFDEKGNVIEYFKYEDTGKIKTHEKYEYDEDNNKIKEIKYNPVGKIIKTIVYKYEDGLKTERITSDASNKIIKKEKYVYTFE